MSSEADRAVEPRVCQGRSACDLLSDGGGLQFSVDDWIWQTGQTLRRTGLWATAAGPETEHPPPPNPFLFNPPHTHTQNSQSLKLTANPQHSSGGSSPWKQECVEGRGDVRGL
ncbi:hypothetical protein DPEC_G00001550 [Dallia pectoralis]|uniref:Uncharacterized protein n=1 Tax=Dallia pectoralis TaxID=75939 RepID=A0ACC2HJK4_DALPE|nr:hypothetical protein DPEC_G00001550 [Dallia pectoralis]